MQLASKLLANKSLGLLEEHAENLSKDYIKTATMQRIPKKRELS